MKLEPWPLEQEFAWALPFPVAVPGPERDPHTGDEICRRSFGELKMRVNIIRLQSLRENIPLVGPAVQVLAMDVWLPLGFAAEGRRDLSTVFGQEDKLLTGPILPTNDFRDEPLVGQQRRWELQTWPGGPLGERAMRQLRDALSRHFAPGFIQAGLWPPPTIREE